MVRPHVVNPDQLPATLRQAVLDTYSGSGEKNVSLSSDTWMTVTEGMAAATTTGTAAASHLAGIDFAGKTGTAQVVGGGDTHTKGGLKTPNAWFVGMVPRRNPEFAVVVLQEHGDWGAGSAKLAAQIVTAYVNKKRKQDGNLMLQADKKAAPVEMGAVWSAPETETHLSHKSVAKVGHPDSGMGGMQGGHYVIALANDPLQPLNSGVKFPSRVPANPDSGKNEQAETVVGLPERFRGVLR
jgi:penicillin-binding protein 2